MNILQINSSARRDASHSTALACRLVARLREVDPEAGITVRDLAVTPHPVLDEDVLHALFTPEAQRTSAQADRVRLDPFLMLDAFATDNPRDYVGGFPDHPHRGFETVTYMIAGRMRHRDSAGHEGLLSNGGVQWTTAGRGVIHSELPEQEDGRMEGFQLWLNLAAKDKMRAPWYRDIQSPEIPEFTTPDGVKVRVIAGASHGVEGAMRREVTEPLYLDLEMPAGATFAQALPPSHNAFVYVYRGGVQVGDTPGSVQRMAILKNDAGSDGVVLKSHAASRALLIAGRPLGEPIAQYGPFAMNTNDEIFQAVQDFQAGRFAATA